MQQPHRTRQPDIGAAQQGHLALDPAQRRQRIARPQAAAIQGQPLGPARLGHEGDAIPFQPLAQVDQRRPRVKMRLGRNVQAAVETVGQVRLLPGDAVAIQPAMAADPPGKPIKLAPVAVQGNHHCSATVNGHPLPGPPIGGPLSKPHHRLFRRLALAKRRQHTAGPPRTAVRPRRRRRVEHRHRTAAARQFGGHAQPRDAGPQNPYAGHPHTS